MRRHRLHKRYGHASGSGIPRGYKAYTDDNNSLQENLFRAGLLVGTAVLKGKSAGHVTPRWEWQLAYVPEGSGPSRGIAGGIEAAFKAIASADKKGRRR
jgi:hypothetical protein